MTLDGSSLLEKTQHREAIPVSLNEESWEKSWGLIAACYKRMTEKLDHHCDGVVCMYVFVHMMRRWSSEPFSFSGTKL